MSNALETTKLSKRYGRTWALHDCTLSVPAGRVAALVGPNGAGKTTLLHLAVGLLEPTAGEVQVFGLSPTVQAGEAMPFTTTAPSTTSPSRSLPRPTASAPAPRRR